MGRLVNFAGDERPGGLKLFFVGDGERAVAGVAERESRMRDAGRGGGPMTLSRVAALDARLRVGDGDGDMLESVSKVLSVRDGRGLRFAKSRYFDLSACVAVGFSSPSSNTGRFEPAPGGVVSSVADWTACSASRTGDRFRALLRSAVLQAYPPGTERFRFSPRGFGGMILEFAGRERRGSCEVFTGSSVCSYLPSESSEARGMIFGRRESRGSVPLVRYLVDPWSILWNG